MEGYVFPVSRVKVPNDMVSWKKSGAYSDYLQFVLALNKSVRGRRITDVKCLSSYIEGLIALLGKLEQWVDEIPPIEQPQRFGNKAYRIWYERLTERVETLLKETFPENAHGSIVEIAPYLTESFGNCTRIDYGTGHEMSFVMFLCCLFKLNLLKESDCESSVLIVFVKYIAVVRKLLLTYRLEPAGSQGAWSLDDYHFLPFIFGSSQLIGQAQLEPSAFPKGDPSGLLAKDYMFVECINFILQVKSGPFHEHSNQLWNISGVQSWEKINKGLIKMYTDDVLGKFPIVQHVRFGSLLSFDLCESNQQ